MQYFLLEQKPGSKVKRYNNKKNVNKEHTGCLITEFGRLYWPLQMQCDCSAILLIKLKVYRVELVFKYYGPIYKIERHAYLSVTMSHTQHFLNK